MADARLAKIPPAMARDADVAGIYWNAMSALGSFNPSAMEEHRGSIPMNRTSAELAFS